MNKSSPIQTSIKTTLIFSFVSLWASFNSTAFAASGLLAQSESDFVSKYGVPTQIVPPAKKRQQQTTTDTNTETPSISTATPSVTGPTPQPPQTTPTSPTTPSAQIEDTDSLHLVQPTQKPYESLHQKRVWEKLKTLPHDAPKPEATDETDDDSSSLDTQNVTKHNIYK